MVIRKANITPGLRLDYAIFEPSLAVAFEGKPQPRLICHGDILVEMIICLDREADIHISCVPQSKCTAAIYFPRVLD